MPAFSGKYYYTLDSKGRIIVPAPFREIIAAKYSSKLFITNAPSETCLHIYPLEEWSKLLDKVKSLPRTNEYVKFFSRRVIAQAVEAELDKQGRLIIPLAHRQDAGISGEVVIVGLVDKIELWDRRLWDEVSDLGKIDIKAYEAALSDFGL